MFSTILITGGCRSGKSGYALDLASKVRGTRRLFIATCVAEDEEMRRRVQRHQKERGRAWQTLEEPVDLANVIQTQGPGADLILVDCLTLWVSNLMATHPDDPPFLDRLDKLCQVIARPPCPLIFVTNEVGAGIVPENRLARRFRDLTGWANQKVAATCTTVIWMVAGVAVTIKPGNGSLEGGQA